MALMPLPKLLTNLLKNGSAIVATLVVGSIATAGGGLAIGGLLCLLAGILGIHAVLEGDGGDADRQTIMTWLEELIRRQGSLQAAVDAIRDGRESHELVSRENAEKLSEILAQGDQIEAALEKHEGLLTYGLMHLDGWLQSQSETLESFDTKLKAVVLQLDRMESKVDVGLEIAERTENKVDEGLELLKNKLDESRSQSHELPKRGTFWPDPLILPFAKKIIKLFVGRTEEFDQIDAALEKRHSVICVNGLAGQGKSALLGKWHIDREDSPLFRGGKLGLFWCRPYETYIHFGFHAILMDGFRVRVKLLNRSTQS